MRKLPKVFATITPLLVGLLLAGVALALTSTSSSVKASARDWPMFRHDLRNTGSTEASGPSNNTLKWRFDTGAHIRSSPAVANGKVYVGSDYNYVYAFDAETGDLIWRFETGDRVYSSPAVANGTVYVGYYGYVYALDAETGDLIWRFETGDYVYSSPAVANGTVYVGSYDDYVYALDAETGDLIWRFETGDWVWSSPAVANGTVYVGSRDKYVYAIGKAVPLRIFRVLVVPTRYPDESPEEFNDKVGDFYRARKTSYIQRYFLEQSRGTDIIKWTGIPAVGMLRNSENYEDTIDDKDYSPGSKYPRDLKKILKEKDVGLSMFDAVLAFQSYRASRSNGYNDNFRAITYNPELYPPFIKQLRELLVYKGIPIAIVTYDENNLTIAHELGHALYDFNDFYWEDFRDIIANAGEIYNWGLMGAGYWTDLDPRVDIPIFSLNRVEAGWATWRNVNLGYGEEKEFEVRNLKSAELGYKVLRVNREYPHFVSYIIEGRENSPLDYRISGWMKEHHGIERGLVIYRHSLKPIIPPGWMKVNVNLKGPTFDIGKYLPTLYEREKGGDQLTYADPVTLTVFTYEGYDAESENFKVKVEVDPSYFRNRKGVVLNDLSTKIFASSPTAEVSRGTYPGLDLHAYDQKDRHVGMNYETGEYEIEIPGSIAAGPSSQEWIFVPKGVNVRFEISSEAAKRYLENIGARTDIQLEYTTQGIRYGENPSVEVVENELTTSDISYGTPVTENIVPGETVDVTHLIPKPSKHFPWALVSIVVLVIIIGIGATWCLRRSRAAGSIIASQAGGFEGAWAGIVAATGGLVALAGGLLAVKGRRLREDKGAR